MIHTLTTRVRFSETDALGHLNNVSYYIYLEEARISLLEEIGCSMDTNEWSFIVASTGCDYLSQAYFRQQLLISTTVQKIGTKSFHLQHKMTDEATGEVIANGKSVLVYFNFKQQQSEALPEEIREKLQQYVQIEPNA